MKRLIAMALFAVLVQPVLAQPAPTKIQVAVVDLAPSIFCALSFVRQPGLDRFARSENLVFEPVLVESAVLPTVVSKGDLPIGDCGGLSAIFTAWTKGARNLAVFSVGAVKPFYEIVAAKSIHSLADLRGKSFGTPGLQTASTEAIELILARGAGLHYPGDYELISTGTGSARTTALLTGRIDALPTFPPYGYDLVRQGFTLLGDEADFVPQYVTGPYLVNREWTAQNPDLMLRVVRALLKLEQWMGDPANKSEVIDWYAQNMDLGGGRKLGQDLAARLYADMVENPRLSFTGYAPEAAVRANIDILIERNQLAPSDAAHLEQVFDWSWLNKVRAEQNQPPVAAYVQ